MLLINDVHLGVHRKGGTTPASQEALRSFLFSRFKSALTNPDDRIVIVGDLFDEFDISARDWLETFSILNACLSDGKRLTLVAGNHDWSNKGSRVSSFQMLCEVLGQSWPDNFDWVGINETYAFPNDPVWAVAHCSNQDIFNDELQEVLGMVSDGDYVLLHANYDNNFAAVSDHSLNVSEEQAAAFAAKGATLVFAHEHQARQIMTRKVVVMGNQWPTSIADCLNNDKKFMHTIEDGKLSAIPTWSINDEESGYYEIDWRELSESTDLKGFIKVVGSASSNEAGDVISAIAKYRSKSEAFVISNGVAIDGIVACEQLPESFEAAKSFDVMAFIKENTTAEEYVVIESLRS